MRLLVLTDIHANLSALDAALTEVTSRIRELGAVTIRGNHDKAVAELMPTDDFNPVAKAAVNWTRSQLSNENLDWLAGLPQGPLEAEGVVLVHGAFQDEDEYVFTPSQALEGLLDSTSQVTFFGHTHHQGGFAYQDPELEVLSLHPRTNETRCALRLEDAKRYLLNPGSIGQPRDTDPRAGFAIADLENHTVEFWRVPYDITGVQKRMRDAKLPQPLVLRLQVGRCNCFAVSIALVRNIHAANTPQSAGPGPQKAVADNSHPGIPRSCGHRACAVDRPQGPGSRPITHSAARSCGKDESRRTGLCKKRAD